MPDQTYQLPRDSTMQGIVTQLQNIASRMNNSGSGSGGSGGGSTVVANPSGTASDDLTSIEINGTVYDIPSGSGSSYDDTALRALIAAKQDALTPGTGIQISNGTISCTVQGGSDSGGVVAEETVLYTNSGTSRESFTLSDDYTNYDQLKIIVERNNSGTIIESPANLYDTSEIANAASIQVYWFGSEYAAFSVPTTDPKTTFTLLGGDGIGYIKKVIGIKYVSGSGNAVSPSGGTSSEVIPIEAGDGTLSRTFHLDKTPSMVVMSYFEGENDSGWSSQYVLIWGSARAYGTATGTPTSTTGESKTIGITYGADGKSFTINAANAGSALNTTTGHGYLLCFYNEGSGSSSGGASGYSITSLYNNDSGLTTVGEITLSDSILDYDDLEFIVGINTSVDHSHQSYRISSKYFYDYFKYGTQHSDDHFMVSPWYDMACGFTLGQNNDPTKINFYDMYAGNSGINTALYSINGIKYGSGSSAGGTGYSEETLWTGTASLLESSTVNLSKAYTGYDALRFEYNAVRGDNNGRLQYYEKTVSKSTLAQEHFIISDFYLWNGAGVNSSGTFTDPTTIVTLYEGSYWFQSCTLTKVVGIKYGSGGASSGAGGERIVEKIYTAADNTVGVTVETDKPMTDYDYIIVECNEITGGPYINTQIVLKEELQDAIANSKAICPVYLNDGWYAYYYVTDESTLTNKTSVKMYISAVYGVKEGSGGSSNGTGRTQTKIWDYVTDNNNAVLYGLTTATLHQSIDDFDELIMEVVSILSDETDATWKGTTQFIVDVNALKNSFEANYISLESLANRSSKYYISGTTLQKTAQATENTNGLVSVYGVKYDGGNSSSQGSSGIELPGSEIIEIAAGDGTSSRTFTFTRKPKLVHVWFTVPEKWSMSEDIFWGQPWGVYNCTNGNAPYSSGAQGSNTITFDDNNLTMTITGINALGCANNSNGYGYMWVEYGEGSSSGGSSSLAESNKYSTSEKVIGEWVDGKPIYQKTYVSDGTTPLTLPIDLSDLHVDTMIDYKGLCNSYSVSFPNTARVTSAEMHYGGNRVLYWDVDSQSMKHSGNTDKYYHLTIQYTKSTD